MRSSVQLRILCFSLALLAACRSADAHNLFVLVKHQPGSPDLVDVIFEHSPSPGKGGYNKPLIDRGKTWVRQLGVEKNVALKLNEVDELGKKHLRAETKTARPRVVVHKVTWGIYSGRLDHFYGKDLDVSSRDDLKRLARCRELPLDLVPSVSADALTIHVLFQGKPVPNTRVSIWAPKGKKLKLKTNSDGKIKLDAPVGGTYHFATYHTLKTATGKFEGKPFKGVMHGSSCTIRWPLK